MLSCGHAEALIPGTVAALLRPLQDIVLFSLRFLIYKQQGMHYM